MKIKWSREALERLIEIEDYISKDSPARAAKFVDQLIEHAESLSDKPLIGRIVPELSTPAIRELIVKKYRLVYRFEGHHIDILTVFEGHKLLRMDAFEVDEI